MSHSAAGRLVATVTLIGAGLLSAGGAFGQSAQQDARDIEVIVRRYAFDPPRIEVVVGERVRLLVVSADGVHGLEIKRFKVNKEIPRGSTPVVIEFTATEVGKFPVLCSEYCGEGHADMKGELVVVARNPQTTEELPDARE